MRVFITVGFALFLLKANSQITLSYMPVKEKFIYEGVDNPIIIEGLNQLTKPNVMVVRGTVKKGENKVYYINPVEADSCKVVIRDLFGIQVNFSIPVRPTPEPDVLLCGSLGSGLYSSLKIKSTDSLALKISDFDWEISFGVDSFNVTRISNQSIENITNVGSKFNDKTKEIINKAINGDIYIFDNLFYSKPYKKMLLNKSLVLRIL